MLVVAMIVIAGCADDQTDATEPPADDVLSRISDVIEPMLVYREKPAFFVQ